MRNKLLGLWLLVAAVAMAGPRDGFPYVFKRGSGSIIRINGTIEAFTRIQKRFQGEYIWLSRNGREYLIRDASVLAAARDAFAHMEALEPQMRAAEARMRPVEKKFEALEEKIDKLSDRGEEVDAALERQLDALEAELEKLERASEAIEQEMERREVVAEKKFEQIVIRAVDEGKAERLK